MEPRSSTATTYLTWPRQGCTAAQRTPPSKTRRRGRHARSVHRRRRHKYELTGEAASRHHQPLGQWNPESVVDLSLTSVGLSGHVDTPCTGVDVGHGGRVITPNTLGARHTGEWNRPRHARHARAESRRTRSPRSDAHGGTTTTVHWRLEHWLDITRRADCGIRNCRAVALGSGGLSVRPLLCW
jgi:hypothetical protein